MTQKLTTRELIAVVIDHEGYDNWIALATGMMLFRADPMLWSILLNTRSDGIENGDAIAECQSWMDQQSQLVRDNWDGNPVPLKSNRPSGLNYYLKLANYRWFVLPQRSPRGTPYCKP